jgi:hypothetical protein
VQLTYLGFPGSTGLPGVDYVIADEFLITPEMTEHFTEKPLYLPDCFQINDRQRQIAPKPSRASSACRKTFVFCSFNNNFKFTPELFAMWMNILRRVPDSVLWLVADYQVRENLFRYAEQAGIDRPPDLQHARRAGRISGALPAGRPVPRHLPVQRRHHRQRCAVGRPAAADLRRPDLLVAHGGQPAARGRPAAADHHSFADYEEKAVALATTRRHRRHEAQLQQPPELRAVRQPALRAQSGSGAAQHRQTGGTACGRCAGTGRSPSLPCPTTRPDLIAALLRSLRQHYTNRVYIIDGSSPDVAEQIRAITAAYDNVEFIPFGYNIHHGPGMAWAINNLGLSGECCSSIPMWRSCAPASSNRWQPPQAGHVRRRQRRQCR